MNCEHYNDFVVVCSFMSIFGENLLFRSSDRVPSLYRMKTLIERSDIRKLLNPISTTQQRLTPGLLSF